jgi:hypothetical protein
MILRYVKSLAFFELGSFFTAAGGIALAVTMSTNTS